MVVFTHFCYLDYLTHAFLIKITLHGYFYPSVITMYLTTMLTLFVTYIGPMQTMFRLEPIALAHL